MDEKSQAKAQLERPHAPLGRGPGPSGTRWLKIVIGLALMAALGWGFALGVGYYSRQKSAPAPRPAPAAPAPTTTAAPADRSVTQPVEAQSALEAYRSHLKFSDVTADYEDDLLEGDVPVVRGKLENQGDRTLSYVEITAYFLNKDGRRIHEKPFPIVGAPLNLTGEAPLRPGYINSFAFKASDTPTEWASGHVEVEVTAIRFGP